MIVWTQVWVTALCCCESQGNGCVIRRSSKGTVHLCRAFRETATNSSAPPRNAIPGPNCWSGSQLAGLLLGRPPVLGRQVGLAGALVIVREGLMTGAMERVVTKCQMQPADSFCFAPVS